MYMYIETIILHLLEQPKNYQLMKAYMYIIEYTIIHACDALYIRRKRKHTKLSMGICCSISARLNCLCGESIVIFDLYCFSVRFDNIYI